LRQFVHLFFSQNLRRRSLRAQICTCFNRCVLNSE
jgi:hypothetical protein